MPSFEADIRGQRLSLETHPSLFSPRQPDRGTLAMLSCVELQQGDRLLDLGCGYGLVGIYAAHVLGAENVVMTDVDQLATEFAGRNAVANGVGEIDVVCSDGFTDLRHTGFTKILSNPPYHADFSVPRHFILKGFNRLQLHGEMWLVTRRKTWYLKKLQSVFGGADVRHVNGYYVFRAEKRRDSYAGKR